MNVEIGWKPYFKFKLSISQFDLIWELSKTHYDGVCKAQTKVGGLLYKFRNLILDSDNDVEIDVSFREADLLLKIMENVEVQMMDRARINRVKEVRNDLAKAMECSNIDFRAIRINKGN